MNGGDVLEAAGECRTLLGAAVDRDWTQPIPEMDWDGVNPADRRRPAGG